MGKLSSGIFGGVSGKVGNLTGSSWKGIQVVKSRPQSVAYPGTAGQVAQTTKMAAIVLFCKLILSSWIKPLWDRSAVKMSGYNAFVQANIAEFEDGEINDYSTLLMSRGTMQSPTLVTLNPHANDSSISFTWTTSPFSGLELGTDIAYCLYINETNGEVKVGSGNPRTSGGYVLFLDKDLVEGDVIHQYLTFKRSNGAVISTNAYKRLVVTA